MASFVLEGRQAERFALVIINSSNYCARPVPRISADVQLEQTFVQGAQAARRRG